MRISRDEAVLQYRMCKLMFLTAVGDLVSPCRKLRRPTSDWEDPSVGLRPHAALVCSLDFAAKSSGAGVPGDGFGHSRLSSSLHAVIFARASAGGGTRGSVKSSSRKRSLNGAAKAVCIGFPGAIQCQSIRVSRHRPRPARPARRFRAVVADNRLGAARVAPRSAPSARGRSPPRRRAHGPCARR